MGEARTAMGVVKGGRTGSGRAARRFWEHNSGLETTIKVTPTERARGSPFA